MQPFDGFLDPVHSFLAQTAEILPKILLGILILVLGWLAAKVVRFAVVKALRAINFNVLTEKAGLDTFLKQGGGETDTTGILGLLVYRLIILIGVALALALAFGLGGQKRAADFLERWSRRRGTRNGEDRDRPPER